MVIKVKFGVLRKSVVEGVGKRIDAVICLRIDGSEGQIVAHLILR